MDVVVREVPGWSTYQLRRDVLRPGRSLEEVASEDRTAVSPRYFALFDNGDDNVVSTAMVQLKAPLVPLGDGLELSSCYQLRAMATRPERRRQGLGGLLLEAVIETVALAGGSLLWCNARVAAVPFYERYQLRQQGGPFEIEGVGAHVVMWRAIGSGAGGGLHRAQAEA